MPGSHTHLHLYLSYHESVQHLPKPCVGQVRRKTPATDKTDLYIYTYYYSGRPWYLGDGALYAVGVSLFWEAFFFVCSGSLALGVNRASGPPVPLRGVDAFTPGIGDNSLEVSIGRDFGALKGLLCAVLI